MAGATTLGRLQAVLGLDAREFSGGIDKAKTDVAGFGVNAKTGFAVAGTAAAVGFGLMTRGALEMESAQGKFQAATGASREEAIAFSQDMNGLVGTAGTVGMSFEDISDAGIAVSQQFGITGEDAKTLTGDILEFAKVTGQDAEQAAFQLEDTLSAYNLTAADAVGVMDKLIASNQKYGTDAGPEAIATLQGFAPALEAMGMGIDDGIELLNAFEVAGLDAGSAQKGLQKAIDGLKPGETIDDLIAQIAAIEDPLLKNQAAVDIFGAKAGPGLAAIIKPGMTSLDEFGISADEAAGSVDDAADDMLTTGDKFKMFAEQIGGHFRNAGQMFGPLITAAATVGGPLAAALGGSWDKIKDSPVIKTAIEGVAKVTGPIYSAAMKVGEAIGSALSSAWDLAKSAGKRVIELAGAAAGALYAGAVKVGEAIGSALSAAWDLAKTAGQAAINLAGAAAGVVYAGAMKVGDAIGSVLGVAWDGLKALLGKPLGVAVGAAGAAAGTLYAGAMKAGEVIGGVLSLAWNAVGSLGSSAMAAAGAAGTKVGGAFIGGVAAGVATGGVLAAMIFGQEFYNEVLTPSMGSNGPDAFNAAFEHQMSQAGANAGAAAAEATVDTAFNGMIAGFGRTGSPIPEGWGVPAAERAGEDIGVGVGKGLIAAQEHAAQDAREMMRFAGQAMEQQGLADARTLGGDIPGALSAAMTASDNMNILTEGARQLRNILENGLTPEDKAMQAIGQDYIQLLRDGINSQKVGAVETARTLAVEAISAIEQAGLQGAQGQKGLRAIGQHFDTLLASGMTAQEALAALDAAGVSASSEAMAGIRSKYPQFFTTGQGAADRVHSGFTDQPWSSWGAGAAGEWISGFANGVDRKTWFLQNKIDKLFEPNSPPRVAPDIDKQGFKTGALWADSFGNGMSSLLGRAQGVLANLAAPIFGPTLAPALAGAGAAAATGGGETHYHYHVEVEGLVRAETPEDIGRQMRRIGHIGLPPRS